MVGRNGLINDIVIEIPVSGIKSVKPLHLSYCKGLVI